MDTKKNEKEYSFMTFFWRNKRMIITSIVPIKLIKSTTENGSKLNKGNDIP